MSADNLPDSGSDPNAGLPAGLLRWLRPLLVLSLGLNAVLMTLIWRQWFPPEHPQQARLNQIQSDYPEQPEQPEQPDSPALRLEDWQDKDIRASYADATGLKLLLPGQGVGQPLPRQLTLKPGMYQIGAQSYDMRQEGLYRFSADGLNLAQRIVYDQNLDSLLSSLAWIVSHGNAHEKLAPVQQIEQALSGKLSLTCGSVVAFALRVLAEKGYQARMVQAQTTEPWNRYDNGHTMLEIWRPDYKKWVLYDLAMNSDFPSPQGPLSLWELSRLINQGKPFQPRLISHDSELDIAFSGIFNEELTQLSPVQVDSWYRRVLQVPVMFDKGRSYVSPFRNKPLQPNQAGLTVLTPELFLKRFYGPPPAVQTPVS